MSKKTKKTDASNDAPSNGSAPNGDAANDAALDTLPSRGLLSFYDRLRDGILASVDRRGGKLGSRTVEFLLLVPDVFILLVRLALDRDVPKSARTLVASTLAYFVLPVDFLPEAVLGAGGFLDDLVLAVAMLSQVFGGELEPYAEKHWSGSRKLREVLRDVLEAARNLVGHNVYGRLEKLLGKKGVDLDAAAEGAKG